MRVCNVGSDAHIEYRSMLNIAIPLSELHLLSCRFWHTILIRKNIANVAIYFCVSRLASRVSRLES